MLWTARFDWPEWSLRTPMDEQCEKLPEVPIQMQVVELLSSSSSH